MTQTQPIIECEDCIKALDSVPDGYIHLTVTSPPYDGIRDYNGAWSVDLPMLGKKLLRATADGGVCAMVIQDGTEDGHKTTTTARTICSWVDSGWGLFETCIWSRPGTAGAWWNKRFRVDHEFILLFIKGKRPRVFDKEPLKVPAIWAGTMQHGSIRATNGSMVAIEKKPVADTKCRGTVWTTAKSNTEKNSLKSQHPATFPDAIAADIIRCFSSTGDVVFDPFMGSGTTIIQAHLLGREAVGCDISPEYVQIARERFRAECA